MVVPKTVRKLTDVEHARAVNAYILNEGDIEATYKALSRKIGKRTLRWYATRFAWDIHLERAQNELIELAIDDAVSKKRIDLQMLASAKTELYRQIIGQQDSEGNWIIPPAAIKSLGEGVRAMVECIREERTILGNTDGSDADKTPGLLLHIRKAIEEGGGIDVELREGNGKSLPEDDHDDDPFNLRQ